MVRENDIQIYDSLFTLMATSDEDDDKKSKTRGNNYHWYVDYGCSKHMIEEIQDFLSFKAHKRGSVSFGDGNKRYIVGIGKVRNCLGESFDDVHLVDV